MTGTKKYYPGMFDLIKGYAMISIIVDHVYCIFPYKFMTGEQLSLPMAIVTQVAYILSFGYALMPLFFMISGFSFSTSSMKKCIKKQVRILLKPYLMTGIFVTVVRFFAHYFTFHSLSDAIFSAVQITLAHLLGITKTTTIGGMELYFVGSVWFLLALFFSWILFNAITLYVPVRYRFVTSLSFVCIGYLAGNVANIPFCLSQSFIGVGYMFVGQLIKKNDWLYKKIPISVWCITILFSVISLIFGQVSMAYSVWKLGPIDIIGAGCAGFLLARASVQLNGCTCQIADWLRKVGRYSFWIMCIHTVEFQGLPWFLYVNKFNNHPFPAFLILVVIRLCFIFVICNVVNRCNKLLIKRKYRLKRG